jgi:hypothetical protein
MKLPDDVKAIRTRYVAKYPVPQGTPETIDDLVRAWTVRFCEQVHFDTKDARYGAKRADPGRPIGKDTLARNDASGLIGWDLLLGTGTGHPTLYPDPDSLALGPGTPDGGASGQVFVPVAPVDHLAGSPVPPDPTPPPSTTYTLDTYFAFRNELEKIYQEELFRSVACDPDAIVNWLFHWREEGKDAAWIRARIKESPEWHSKHPNG